MELQGLEEEVGVGEAARDEHCSGEPVTFPKPGNELAQVALATQDSRIFSVLLLQSQGRMRKGNMGRREREREREMAIEYQTERHRVSYKKTKRHRETRLETPRDTERQSERDQDTRDSPRETQRQSEID